LNYLNLKMNQEKKLSITSATTEEMSPGRHPFGVRIRGAVFILEAFRRGLKASHHFHVQSGSVNMVPGLIGDARSRIAPDGEAGLSWTTGTQPRPVTLKVYYSCMHTNLHRRNNFINIYSCVFVIIFFSFHFLKYF
jgi:hypothetical protein